MFLTNVSNPTVGDIMIPVGVNDEVQEPVPALCRHPTTNSPTIVRVVHGVMRLAYGQPDLVQHGGQAVGAGARVQLSPHQQRVTEADNRVTVVDKCLDFDARVLLRNFEEFELWTRASSSV